MFEMKTFTSATLIVGIALCLSSLSQAAGAKWTPLGMTGCGGMFSPTISPVNPKLMMLNCDMSGAYISHDGGQSWEMIPCTELKSSTACRPAFHPTEENVIFAAQGGGGMFVTSDGGKHWQPITDSPQDLRGEIAIDPTSPSRMMAGNAAGVFISNDAGKHWQKCNGPAGSAIAFHFDQTSPAASRVCLAATAQGIWRSDDGGKTWAAKDNGLPAKEIRSFCGGSNAKTKAAIMYCVVPGKASGGKYEGGVFKSTDRGDTWTSVMGGGINVDTKAYDEWAQGSVAQYSWVLTNDIDPTRVWAFNANTGCQPPHHATAYRSDDAGASWRATFQADSRFGPSNVEKGNMMLVDGQFYQSPPFGVAIDARNPDHVMMVANDAFYTEDGGKYWHCGHIRMVPGSDKEKDPRWLCNGLVVTTTWNYYIDPSDPTKHYICYTDIGLARSLDAGKTWIWWALKGRPPWINTCFELAFEPQKPGKIWGAFSDVHDIPNGNIIWGNHSDKGPGGVAVSEDFGQTWHACNNGLPAAAVVSVIIDPKSQPGSRTLYASVFNHGVYKSTDDGKTWHGASDGLGSPNDMRACKLQLHKDGTLFVLVTAMKQGNTFVKDGPGIYKSTDGAKTWSLANTGERSRFFWPKDFTVDPDDSKTIYVGSAGAWADQNGLWRTTDGGTHWTRLAKEGPEHFGAYLSPKHKGWIYMTLTEGAPGSGLWLSKDDGKTWKPMSLPFANAQRVAFDPADDGIIYVTTFGGSVWKGPASE
jgi:photosystem II stability/assembly factor-like uncharacterized protein